MKLFFQTLGFRIVEPTKTIEIRKQNFIGSLVDKTIQPVSERSAVFVSKPIEQKLKTSRSSFGHPAFGSNLLLLTSQAVMSSQTKTVVSPAPKYLSVNKTMLLSTIELPEILRAVGLVRKISCAPKCY